jgi:hypothetical protein
MRLRHFFENMVRREETASAFLATLLDYDPTFRFAFLRLIIDDEAGWAADSWKVTVEEDRVDVTLESATAYVLIEDKIGSGAKQQGQLLRYYRGAVEAKPEKRVVAVYLAPGGMGIGEVEAVRGSAEFAQRKGDIARHLSWGEVAQLVNGLPEDERLWFARSGMDEIERVIAQARQEKYPALGERALVRDIADAAIATISGRCPDVRLGRWNARDVEVILTYGTPVTLWLHAAFEVASEPPFAPVGLVREDGIHLSINTYIKLARKVRRGSDLDRRWRDLVKIGVVDVPGVGIHKLQPDGWFGHSRPTVGSAAELENLLADTGQWVLDYMSPLFLVRAYVG